jgi:hypothetical protein
MPRSFGITNAAPYAAAPAVGNAGDTYWNTATKTLYVSDGSAWNPWPSGGGTGETIRSITTNATLNNGDIALVDCSGGNITLTAPITSNNTYVVKRVDSSTNTLTVVPSSGTVDGDPNLLMVGQWAACTLEGDGTNLRIRSGYSLGSMTPSPWPANIFQEHTGQQVTSITNLGWNGPFGAWATPGGTPIGSLGLTAPGALSVNAANDGALLLINFQMGWVSNTSGRRVTAVFINNTEANRMDVGSGGNSAVQCQHIYRATAGDVIDCRVWQSSGAALALSPIPSGHRMQFVRIG